MTVSHSNTWAGNVNDKKNDDFFYLTLYFDDLFLCFKAARSSSQILSPHRPFTKQRFPLWIEGANS